MQILDIANGKTHERTSYTKTVKVRSSCNKELVVKVYIPTLKLCNIQKQQNIFRLNTTSTIIHVNIHLAHRIDSY